MVPISGTKGEISSHPLDEEGQESNDLDSWMSGQKGGVGLWGKNPFSNPHATFFPHQCQEGRGAPLWPLSLGEFYPKLTPSFSHPLFGPPKLHNGLMPFSPQEPSACDSSRPI